MKKILSVSLALLMVSGMGLSVFAQMPGGGRSAPLLVAPAVAPAPAAPVVDPIAAPEVDPLGAVLPGAVDPADVGNVPDVVIPDEAVVPIDTISAGDSETCSSLQQDKCTNQEGKAVSCGTGKTCQYNGKSGLRARCDCK